MIVDDNLFMLVIIFFYYERNVNLFLNRVCKFFIVLLNYWNNFVLMILLIVMKCNVIVF